MTGIKQTQAEWLANEVDLYQALGWPSGCTDFPGHVSEYGYGLLWARGRSRPAHVEAWRQVHGDPPDTLDHLADRCASKACFNLTHLEPVTRAENARRGFGAKQAAKTHCPRGHEYTEANTYRRPGRRGRSCRACWRKGGRSG